MLRKSLSIVVFSLLILFNIGTVRALSSDLTNALSVLINSKNIFLISPEDTPLITSIQPHFDEVFIGSNKNGFFLGQDAPFGIITDQEIALGIETSSSLGLFSATSAFNGIYIDDANVGIYGSSLSGAGISVLSSSQIGVLTKGVEIGLMSQAEETSGSFGLYSLGNTVGIVSQSSAIGAAGISNGIGGVKGVRQKAGELSVGILGTEQYGAYVSGSAYISNFNHTFYIQENAYFGS